MKQPGKDQELHKLLIWARGQPAQGIVAQNVSDRSLMPLL